MLIFNCKENKMKTKQRVVSMETGMNTMRSSLAKKFNMFLMAGLMSVGFMAPSFATVEKNKSGESRDLFCDSINEGHPFSSVTIDPKGNVECSYKNGSSIDRTGNVFEAPHTVVYWYVNREANWYCNGIYVKDTQEVVGLESKADLEPIATNCPFNRKGDSSK
jgi:hypothetical protein